MFKGFLEKYFAFNKQQRNGLLVLVSISFMLLIVRLVFPYFIHPDEIEIKNLPLLPVEKSLGDRNKFSDSSMHYSESAAQTTSNNVKTTLFVFNPNTVSYEQLLQLGFKEKIANTFIKYRSKGFTFKRKEDLKKVYGLNESLYNTIEPYIQIESNHLSHEKTNSQSKFIAKIEINNADTQQFLSIPLIDLSAAKRIFKLREKLGGFISLNQLNEVYGFDENYCKKLKPYFTCNPQLVNKLNLNGSTFYTLNKHPYIDEDLAKKIIEFRKKTRINLSNFSDLLNDEQLFDKLIPYLSFE